MSKMRPQTGVLTSRPGPVLTLESCYRQRRDAESRAIANNVARNPRAIANAVEIGFVLSQTPSDRRLVLSQTSSATRGTRLLSSIVCVCIAMSLLRYSPASSIRISAES